MGIQHAFTSAKTDGPDPTKVQPSNWNDDHILSGVGFGNRRQTVVSGPVTSAGLPNFGGSTGSTTVTMSGDLVVSVAAGHDANGAVDRIGLITNASWTGLSSDGTRYLALRVAADGTCTTVVLTADPVDQEMGTPATTNDVFTFNVAEMKGYLGNGSSAPQDYLVLVGEVTVAGSVVTAIKWYGLNGRYVGAWTATLPGTSTAVVITHNLGCTYLLGPVTFEAECTTANNGYAIGDQLMNMAFNSGGVMAIWQPTKTTRNTLQFATGATSGGMAPPKGGGGPTNLTAGSWKYRAIVNRGY